jgi:Fe2+ transport system protein FeoA
MIYEVIDVPQKNPCGGCNPCMRMRLLELGFMNGVDIDVKEKLRGMYIVDILSETGNVEQTLALRKEEIDRVCYKLK